MRPLTFFLDFDGTIVEHLYPLVGRVVPHSVRVVRRLQDAGHIVILNSYRADCRNGTLEDATNWLESTWKVGKDDLKPISILSSKVSPYPFITNGNLQIHHDLTIGGIVYLDDEAEGTPTIPAYMSIAPMVDWLAVEQVLEANHLFKPTDSINLSKTLDNE
jgi:hypothetical protein